MAMKAKKSPTRSLRYTMEFRGIINPLYEFLFVNASATVRTFNQLFWAQILSWASCSFSAHRNCLSEV